MREIKFRAWDKEKKQMRDVTSINWYDEYLWVDETPMSGDRLSIEGTPLMQYTGLKDKNGKEIYEDDILKLDFDYPDRIGVVKYSGASYYMAKDTRSMLSYCVHANDTTMFMGEIIGNIYENPELLEEIK